MLNIRKDNWLITNSFASWPPGSPDASKDSEDYVTNVLEASCDDLLSTPERSRSVKSLHRMGSARKCRSSKCSLFNEESRTTRAVQWASTAGYPEFSYRTMKLSDVDIRLLKVAVSDDGLAVGWLEVYPLLECPRFAALSYMWGSGEQLQTSLINGEEFMVSRNLHRFLRVYAARLPGQYILIDQICIDQSEAAEKSSQVQIMPHIYRRAAKVIIWIHPSRQSYCYINNQDRHWYGGEKSPICEKLQDLLENEYWSRVWIVQEVLLGRARTIHYGSSILSWGELGRLVNGSVYCRNRSISKHLRWLLEHAPGAKANGVDFNEAFGNCYDSGARDPRDHVYGLQGLFAPELRLHVDYDISVKEIFIDAVVTYSTSPLKTHLGLSLLARSMGISHKANGPTLDDLIGELMQ